MSKLLLTSVLLATALVPVLTAADPSPARALRRCLLATLAFDAFYLFALVYLYPRV